LIEDWEIEVSFKNLPTYRIPYYSWSYTSRASKPGVFSATMPLNAETMDLLRGSELGFIYKGERMFEGKVVNKTPNFDSGVVALKGLDWNGILFDRQIGFQGYDDSVYAYAGADYWDWNKSKPPGQSVEIEGSALIKLIMRHYLGEDIDDYFFDITNIEAGLTKKKWRFEGESVGESFSKIASVMQASTTRFGYNWWVDAYKRFWLKRFGDSIYRKALNAKWGPPSEDSSSVVNHVHLIGGIATPFPDDRESITDIATFSLTATNDASNNHKSPTVGSKGWGCWIAPRRTCAEVENTSGDHWVKVEAATSKGYVSGEEQNAVVVSFEKPTNYSEKSPWGFYYEVDNANAKFYNQPELRDWSDRSQNATRVTHQIRTLSFYLRMSVSSTDRWQEIANFKLKIYTQQPSFYTGSGYPTYVGANGVREEKVKVYELDLTDLVSNYQIANWNAEAGATGDQGPWLRVLIVFDKALDVAADAAEGSCPAGGGAGVGGATGDYTSAITLTATLDVFSGESPDPADIWGFGFECNAWPGGTGDISWLAIDHMFFGFGEVEVSRRDELSIAMLNREIEKWIQDRKCHSWSRAEHLAEVLLDSLKYAQKSRAGVLDYFNPELRVNQLVPVNEYGVEWMYVIDEIKVDVSLQGVKQTIKVGTPRPDPDELFDFYQVEMSSVQAAGSGRTVHDWVANTKCFTRCEMFCEFACLTDWNTSLKRGGRVCQTSRELSCVNCESVAELNPCVVACLKYSQIASITQRPAAERSDIETTLLVMGQKASASFPEKGRQLRIPTEEEIKRFKDRHSECIRGLQRYPE